MGYVALVTNINIIITAQTTDEDNTSAVGNSSETIP
jgi:hypothetical protein